MYWRHSLNLDIDVNTCFDHEHTIDTNYLFSKNYLFRVCVFFSPKRLKIFRACLFACLFVWSLIPFDKMRINGSSWNIQQMSGVTEATTDESMVI